MNESRAQALLAQINAAVRGDVRVLPSIPRIHELVSRALVEPMTITPDEVQELARAIVLYFPIAEPHSAVTSGRGNAG